MDKKLEGTCDRCGARIHLVKTGISTNAHKWVTDPKKPLASWKCEPTRDFPVLSHKPA
jgi:hypothetical protein